MCNCAGIKRYILCNLSLDISSITFCCLGVSARFGFDSGFVFILVLVFSCCFDAKHCVKCVTKLSQSFYFYLTMICDKLDLCVFTLMQSKIDRLGIRSFEKGQAESPPHPLVRNRVKLYLCVFTLIQRKLERGKVARTSSSDSKESNKAQQPGPEGSAKKIIII